LRKRWAPSTRPFKPGRRGRSARATSTAWLWQRRSRRATDVLPICEQEGLGFTPFSPLAGGWLTGKYRRGEAYPSGSRMTLRPDPYDDLVSDTTFDGLEAFAFEAAARGVAPATLAIAWVLGHPQVTGVVVGPRGTEQLDAALTAAELELTQQERAELAGLFA
jgi:aryl-alcohol dehydrogenase-like predicted oxidoreductase